MIEEDLDLLDDFISICDEKVNMWHFISFAVSNNYFWYGNVINKLLRYASPLSEQSATIKDQLLQRVVYYCQIQDENGLAKVIDKQSNYNNLVKYLINHLQEKNKENVQEIPSPTFNILNEYKKDQIIDTEIKNITEFGIFAKLNENIDGLIHKNDLSWTDSNGDRTLKKYQKGQNIQVKILEIDPEKEKISFGIKQLSADPFNEFFKDKSKGDIVSATITKINNNGIDVDVASFIETTIRRKELSKNKEEQNISRYNEGQKIDAKISSIDLTNRKFSLSIRQLEIDEEQSLLEKYGSKSSGSVLGDILGKALDEDKGSKEE